MSPIEVSDFFDQVEKLILQNDLVSAALKYSQKIGLLAKDPNRSDDDRRLLISLILDRDEKFSDNEHYSPDLQSQELRLSNFKFALLEMQAIKSKTKQDQDVEMDILETLADITNSFAEELKTFKNGNPAPYGETYYTLKQESSIYQLEALKIERMLETEPHDDLTHQTNKELELRCNEDLFSLQFEKINHLFQKLSIKEKAAEEWELSRHKALFAAPPSTSSSKELSYMTEQENQILENIKKVNLPPAEREDQLKLLEKTLIDHLKNLANKHADKKRQMRIRPDREGKIFPPQYKSTIEKIKEKKELKNSDFIAIAWCEYQLALSTVTKETENRHLHAAFQALKKHNGTFHLDDKLVRPKSRLLNNESLYQLYTLYLTNKHHYLASKINNIERTSANKENLARYKKSLIDIKNNLLQVKYEWIICLKRETLSQRKILNSLKKAFRIPSNTLEPEGELYKKIEGLLEQAFKKNPHTKNPLSKLSVAEALLENYKNQLGKKVEALDLELRSEHARLGVLSPPLNTRGRRG